jgi:protein-S-isoprenylcysteine O-methyltransferase Ste14
MKPIMLMSFLFGFSELLLLLIKRSKSGRTKIQKDKGSLIVLWVAITVGITAGFIFSKPNTGFFSGFGIGFIIGGLVIRWLSIIQLGKSFTVDVAITDSAQLITDGMYERIRHPSYSGLLAIVLGFTFAMGSLLSTLVFLIPVASAILYRIDVEEKVMKDEFGDEFNNYVKDTKKIIPGIY